MDISEIYTCKYSITPVTVCMRYLPVHLYNCRVSTAQGKQGKWPNKFPVRENIGNLEILPKQGSLFAQVVNSLLLKNTVCHDICREVFEVRCAYQIAQIYEISIGKISRRTGKTQGIYT